MATSWSSVYTFTGKSTKSHGSYSATMECECGWMWKNNEDNTQLQYAIYSRARYSSANATGYGVETHAYMDHMASDNVATGVLNYGNWVADTDWCYSNWIPRSHETQYIEIWALAKGKTVSGYGAAPEDTGWFKYTDYIGPLASWTVSYDANGGSGAPASQTKWLGEPLPLQSSTPSWEGHTFNGWNTKADGTGNNYAAGASYTGNEALTLYAKWTVNTYQVTFDANGGTNAPAAQSKTHGVNLTITAAKPTRTNYKFLGWATSASATSAQYRTGTNNDQNVTYTTDAPITLYAVWELAYVAPRITNLRCYRCDASGTAADEGTRCYVSFTYTTDTNISSTNYATVTAKVGSNTATTLVAASAHKTGTNTYAGVLADTGLDVNSTYTVAITVTDSQNGSTTSSTVLSQAFFTMDFLQGGHGLAIGKPATTADVFEIGMRTAFPDATALPAASSSYSNFIVMESFANGGKLAYMSFSNAFKRTELQKIFSPTRANTTTANTPKASTGDRSLRHLLATSSMTTAKPEGDGHIIEMAWDNTGGWGSQLYVPNSAGPGWHVQYRPQNGSDTWSDWVRVQNVPVVLYDNASGTNGTVTLSQTAANFDHMRIYAKFQGSATDNFTFCSTDVYSPNGKRVTVMCAGVDNSGITCLYLHTKDVLVSGTSITVQNYGYSWFQSYWATSSTVGIQYENYMYITRVEAWNES